ncbi:hypothetical protein [Chitinophaga sp. S165]|uniref:hypothetical protein n=1 Tax=Chitinophaga sp. S165 TaxID=2135462 RepID=UPI000D845EBB|nr:hypothetical protein [Chitinophaga sp. S165]PWV51467.1 hypothetical protein C7475_10376 [Chitinophaga sp. S165]
MSSIRLPAHVMHRSILEAYHFWRPVIVLPENWKRSDDHSISGELLSAHEVEKETGQTVQQQLLSDMLTANVVLATKIAEEFRTFFTDLRTEPDIKLRINSFSSFELAFVVTDVFYLSRFLEDAHNAAYDLERTHESDTFSIYIHLFPKSKGSDLSYLDSDGFSIFYEPDTKKTALPACSPQ